MKNLLRNKRGATVIIALGISALLMFFSLGVAKVIQNTHDEIKAFKNRSRAYFVSETVMSFITQKIEEGGLTGLDVKGVVTCDSADNCSIVQRDGMVAGPFDGSLLEFLKGIVDSPITVEFEVEGLPKENDKLKLPDGATGQGLQVFSGEWYTVPFVNNGDAGQNCGPSTLKEAKADIRHSCNWGRLDFGNSYTSRVAIPLYYTKVGVSGEPVTVNPIADGDVNNMKIIVRTPCKDPADRAANKPDCERYKLYQERTGDLGIGSFPEQGFTEPEKDKTVVNWEISGLCEGTYCQIVPENKLDALTGYRDFESGNSEITESLINYYSGVENSLYNFQPLLGLSSIGNFVPPKESPNEYVLGGNEGIKSITNPILQLSIVARTLFEKALDGKEYHVPYLEYMILANEKMADASQKVKVTVFYNGQAYRKEKVISQKKNLLDFAVRN